MSTIQWAVKKVKISDLKEYAHNPRRLTEIKLKQLEESLTKFGMCEPLVVNMDNTICGGHGRKKVLERLGITEVDCYYPSQELNTEEFDELNLRLNKNTAGEFNYDIISSRFEIKELQNIGFSLRDLGLDSKIEYSPELDPNFDSSTMSADDVEKARLKEGERFGLDRPKKNVICPKCYHEFEIDEQQ